MVVCADASHANREDGTSQLGYLICLSDKKKGMYFGLPLLQIMACCKKLDRGWDAAVSTAFDAGFTLRHQLAKMLGRHVPLLFMTDGRSLFKAIINHKKTAEERLMLDVYAVRKAYWSREINNMALIRPYNVANALTNIDGNDALLRMLRCGMIDHPIEVLVIAWIACWMPRSVCDSGANVSDCACMLSQL
jgi:hypothetical protein